VIVLDASVVIEVLLNTPVGESLADRVLDPSETTCAPHLLDVEVLQVLRRYARRGDIDSERGRQAVDDLLDLPIERFPHDPFLPRIWELRQNATAYDATYIALAEALGATLLTRDERLARVPDHGATVEIV
jgi:predicted nucleic acid-binding protein